MSRLSTHTSRVAPTASGSATEAWAMSDLHAIAHALGGTISGSEVLAPTPGHSRRDKGTAVRIAPGAPDGILVTCFNGGRDDALAVKDTLRAAGILPAFDGQRRELTFAEREAIRRAEAEREREKRQAQAKAAQIARQRLAQAVEADSGHPYLSAKRIAPERLWQAGNRLLVPMTDQHGAIWNIQTIAPDGGKLFAKDGRTKGVFWFAGKATDRLVIGEGMATVAAIRRATGLPVIAALSAYNLPTVAALVRAKCPDLNIIIAADDDAAGMKAARIAAEQVGASLALPEILHHEC
ncbi:MAG: toprim domain-containing protein [Novosphingobium sp.]|nr:toprim domain-containing protein [Novosphingobium sp.]